MPLVVVVLLVVVLVVGIGISADMVVYLPKKNMRHEKQHKIHVHVDLRTLKISFDISRAYRGKKLVVSTYVATYSTS